MPALAAVDVGLMWVLASRIGVRSLTDRFWLALLFGFSTAIWWVTTRGGVWHTGHLVASALTLLALIELFGRGRAWLIGLLGGAAFLTRAPVIFAMPFFALWYLLPDVRERKIGPATGESGSTEPLDRRQMARPVAFYPGSPVGQAAETRAPGMAGPLTGVSRGFAGLPVGTWVGLTLGFLPALLFFLWYNAVRFGSPLQSGYETATLPSWLAALRDQGLFSLSHLGMNLDYFLWHLPHGLTTFPFIQPDGFGMSILVTSPGLLFALRTDWRDRRSWLLAGAFVFTLVPSLLYYGGGWLQYGYRYALDAIPFAMAMAAMAAARRGIGWGWRLLIVVGFLVNAAGVYWTYHL